MKVVNSCMCDNTVEMGQSSQLFYKLRLKRK